MWHNHITLAKYVEGEQDERSGKAVSSIYISTHAHPNRKN